LQKSRKEPIPNGWVPLALTGILNCNLPQRYVSASGRKAGKLVVWGVIVGSPPPALWPQSAETAVPRKLVCGVG
jgi:hypothetical protein